MKVLLDECLDWGLLPHLPEHDVKTARQMGWTGLKNGRPRSEAQVHFDMCVTVDAQLPAQANPSNYDVAVAVLRVRSTNLRNLLISLPELKAALLRAPKGAATEVV